MDAGVGGNRGRGFRRVGRRVAGWPYGLLRRLDTLLHIPAMPDQTADYGNWTLNWLLTPVEYGCPCGGLAQSSYRG